MELLHLHYFMAVAKYSNFTKAARATFTSQSNISKQIASLEEELGVSLFLRTRTGVEITPAGDHLFHGLSSLLPQLDHLLEDTAAISERSERPVIRLGLCDTMDIEKIIPDFFQKLQDRAQNEFSVVLSSYDIAEIGEKLSVGLIDCAFLFNVSGWEHPDAARIPVSRSNPRLYYSEKHPLFGKPDLSAEDFRKETFIRISDLPGPLDQYEALPYKPEKMINEKSLNTAFLYIISGKAVSVLGPSQNALERKDIHTIELPTEKKVGTDAVWLTTNSNCALDKFITFLKEISPCDCSEISPL